MFPPKWLPDLYLIHRIRRGSREAFADLYDRHAGRIYGLLYRLSSSVETAEDLTQETFVAAYRSLTTYEGQNKFTVWLQEIALRTHSEYSQYSRQPETAAVVSSPQTTGPSEALRARTIRRIADIEPPQISQRMWTGFLRNTGLAGIVAIGVSGAIFVVPRLIPHASTLPSPPPGTGQPSGADTAARSLAVMNEKLLPFMSQVQGAVAHANTWHISTSSAGGKSATQKREIWERVSPYFHRQQDGTNIVIDDGVTLTNMFSVPKTVIERQAPTTTGSEIGSIALLRSSEAAHTMWRYGPMDEGYFSENLFPQKTPLAPPPHAAGQPVPIVEISQKSDSEGHSVSVITYKTATLDENSRYEDYSLVVDTATHLPRRYESHRYLHGTEIAFASTMIPSYNIAIPQEVMSVKPSPTCPVVDLRGLNPMPASLSSVGAKTRLQAREVEIAQDNEGTVCLIYDLCDNSQPYSAQTLAFIAGLEGKSQYPSAYGNERSTPFAGDESNQTYVQLGAPTLSATGHMEVWLTPETPYAQRQTRPKHLVVHFPISMNSWTRWISLVVDLPVKTTVLPDIPQDSAPVARHQQTPLPVLAAIARATFFSRGGREGLLHPQYNQFAPRKPGMPPPIRPIAQMRATHSLAAYWWGVAATESDKVGDHQKAAAYRIRADQVRPVP